MWQSYWIRMSRCSYSFRKLENVLLTLRYDKVNGLRSIQMCCFLCAQDIRKKFSIMEKMNIFMSSIEKYVGLTDNILKSYSMIGVIMIHCSQILYVKGKSNCLFNVIMYTHILSNSFLTGASPNKDVIHAVHKIWHSLIVGIEKLDYKTDANISTMLQHLVVKWLPYFAKMVSFLIDVYRGGNQSQKSHF